MFYIDVEENVVLCVIHKCFSLCTSDWPREAFFYDYGPSKAKMNFTKEIKIEWI